MIKKTTVVLLVALFTLVIYSAYSFAYVAVIDNADSQRLDTELFSVALPKSSGWEFNNGTDSFNKFVNDDEFQKLLNKIIDDSIIGIDLDYIRDFRIVGVGIPFCHSSDYSIRLQFSTYENNPWLIEKSKPSELAMNIFDMFLLREGKKDKVRYWEESLGDKKIYCLEYKNNFPGTNTDPKYVTYFIFFSDDLKRRYMAFSSNDWKKMDKPKRDSYLGLIKELYHSLRINNVLDENTVYLEELISYTRNIGVSLSNTVFVDSLSDKGRYLPEEYIEMEINGEKKRHLISRDHVDLKSFYIKDILEAAIAKLKDGLAKPALKDNELLNFSIAFLYEHNLAGERYGEGFFKKEAINQYQKVLSINPNFNEAKFNIAVIYARTGEYERATEILNSINAKSPIDILRYCLLGYIYGQNGDFAKAKEYYLQAAEEYKSQRGTRFSDYCYKAIKEKIPQLKKKSKDSENQEANR